MWTWIINYTIRYKPLTQTTMSFSDADLFNNSHAVPPRRSFNSESNLRDLELRVNKLELIAEALWEILKKETHLQEADLIELISEIDLRDGKFDGKKAKTTAVRCVKCDRMNSKRHSKCLYCGEVFLLDPFE